jgi:hypothetical protein
MTSDDKRAADIKRSGLIAEQAYQAGLAAGQAERDELRAMWERDSAALGTAIGQRDNARAVAEDNRARYVTAERERDELREALAARRKQMGVACMKHDLTHSLACGRCYAELVDALQAVLTTHSAEAEADMALQNAIANFSNSDAEVDAYHAAATASSEAEAKARAILAAGRVT